MGGGGAAGSSSSYGSYGAPRPRTQTSGTSGPRRRAQPPPGGGRHASGGETVSLDDVFSGAVPAAAVPLRSDVQPSLLPPGTDVDDKRHAPRSAGTARVTPAA